MADAIFNQEYSPAEATRGSWVPLDSSTISDYPLSGRGKYAQISYIVGSVPGALNLALSGGNVILPVSTVSLNEPLAVENTVGQDFVVTQNFPDTTVYDSCTIAATSVQTVTFATPATVVEFFNNDATNTAYIGFNNVALSALSAQALPLIAQSFYSIERTTTNVYIGNVDTSNSIDVRVISHYKA